jgi:hypothetical protein
MSNPNVAQKQIKQGNGTVKLTLEEFELADGSAGLCVTRNPSTQAVNAQKVKEISIRSEPENKQSIEVLILPAATDFFKKHPLKPKTGDPQGRLSVKLGPGETAVFELNGRLGSFKYETDPHHCSGAHHADFHVEEC